MTIIEHAHHQMYGTEHKVWHNYFQHHRSVLEKFIIDCMSMV